LYRRAVLSRGFPLTRHPIEQSPIKRNYNNTGRRAGSDETRTRILEVARELVTTRGYRATTIAELARSAGVHIDTVYELVGRKPAVLRELIERAISGTDRAVAPAERGYVQAMHDEPDPARKLAIYAAAVRGIQQRMAPLLLALRDAATTEPEAKQVWEEISARRARNMRDLVRELGPDGTLRARRALISSQTCLASGSVVAASRRASNRGAIRCWMPRTAAA